MNSATIVGYTFAADNYCPFHIIDALPTGPGQAFDGWALATGASMTTEEDLAEIAAAFSIDRGDEASYDSGEFPKIVLAGMLTDSPADRCACCHELLLGDV